MAEGRSPAEAINSLTVPLQRAVSCLTRAVMLHAHDYRPDVAHWLRLSEDPATLDGTTRLRLRLRASFIVASHPERHGLWMAELVEYRYEFETVDGSELLAYHWHPRGRSHITYRHLHLGPALAIPASPAADAHLPTGIISLSEVLRLAITDLGVTPQRDDWERVLAAVQSAN